MHAEIRYRPTFAAIFVTLAPGESITAVAGAMASMSSHIRARVRFFGGLLQALARRLFGGESLFMSQFYCAKDGRPGEVVVSQPTPGDIQQVELRGTALFVQPGAFLACGPGVRVGLSWAGLASWFGGQGLFRLRLSGEGMAWFGAYGSIVKRQVDDAYLVDTGHLLAYEPTLSLGVALAGGLVSSALGGEGLVSRLSGRGEVYLQSRSLADLTAWTNAHLR
ncbi:MAG TPA: TIGR00266 family protein [Myxococcota bacterium]|nr:TIGR00266 family protein [Myxococcota bacterium]